jgi:Alpha/beta hydrolase domain
MTVVPARLDRPPVVDASLRFVPTGSFRGSLEAFDYVEEEWFATGEVNGHPYATALTVRRPRDPGRFSGTVIVEPVHLASAAPMWIYTSTYQLRSGHAWAAICSQKAVLDTFVKPMHAERYGSLDIWSDAAPLGGSGLHQLRLPREPAAMQARMEKMRAINVLSTPILAQVGAALREVGPFSELGVQNVLLVGHSQTGGVVTDFVLNGHDAHRRPDERPVYDGFYPSGAPSVRFGPCDVPIVQVLSDGDISDPNRPGREGRGYRRQDSDDPADRYRLYELAGVGHMGTRYPPYNDNTMWQNDPIGTAGSVPEDAVMNSLPHDELFAMGLDHLVRWVAGGAPPPRAERIEVGSDGLFVKDECGNSRGGVRCAQMDVPRLRYQSNPGVQENGVPAFGVVGLEEPLPAEVLGRLYGDHGDYVNRFNHRLDELIAQGWFLAEDAGDSRTEAEQAKIP